MSWYRAKKRINENPQMIDPLRLTSYADATKAWNKNGYTSSDDLLRLCDQKMDAKPEGWDRVLHNAAREKRSVLRVFTYNLRFHKARFAAVVLAVLMMIFIATPPGRVLAQNVFDAVVRIVNDIIYIRESEAADYAYIMTEQENTISDTDIESIGDSIIGEQVFHSVDELLATMEMMPAHIKSDNVTFIEAIFEENVNVSVLSSYYKYQNHDVYLNERWWSDEQANHVNAATDGTTKYFWEMNGLAVAGSIDEHKVFVGFCLTEKSTVKITINNIDDSSQVDNILQMIII